MSSQDILNKPSEWPASFPNPDVGTRVLTYVFAPESNIDPFLGFIKEKFPKALVKVDKSDKGSSVTITQTGTTDQFLSW